MKAIPIVIRALERNPNGEVKQLHGKYGSTIECRDAADTFSAWNSKNHQKSVKLQMKEKNTHNT